MTRNCVISVETEAELPNEKDADQGLAVKTGRNLTDTKEADQGKGKGGEAAQDQRIDQTEENEIEIEGPTVETGIETEIAEGNVINVL